MIIIVSIYFGVHLINKGVFSVLKLNFPNQLNYVTDDFG